MIADKVLCGVRLGTATMDPMGEARVRRTDSDYGVGHSLDLYEPEVCRGSAVLLLWHGSGWNERDVLAPLAHRISAAGVTVVVPDWSRNDGGNGRHCLTASLSFARDLSVTMGLQRVVLAGWSLGASAGLDVVLLTTIIGGWRPAAFVGISGGFDDSPFREDDLLAAPVEPSIPLLLIHGVSDEVVPVERARNTFDSLRSRGWDVTLREIRTYHAGAIGTIYDPVIHRCVPADRHELLPTIAGWVAEMALTV